MMHVAGIGASAGGLEAMLHLFSRMQATGRIRYVVAQHMAKDGHDELVVRLIQRSSALPVLLATHGVRMQSDTVYVIPSGKDGQVQDGAISLCDPAPASVSTPSVNVLLQSIARNCRAQGIGIVLSGTGSDGATGCHAIKAAGGITFVQDPLEAKFDGMPQAAIDTRAVDEVMSAQEIAAKLVALFPGRPQPQWCPPTVPSSTPAWPHADLTDIALVEEPGHQELQQLLRQVRDATGIDFSSYKEETLLRRLEKRRALHGIDNAAAYQRFIQLNPAELHALQHLFLVSVSSFFRDRESFAKLSGSLCEMLAQRPPGQPVKVWVPGCASGEEAYTLAIILRELLGAKARPDAVSITGTDLNPEALLKARDGVYGPAAFKEMDDALRQRYFVSHASGLAVCPALREWVRFEQRDVLGGAPENDLGLVSCRNLLIYMKSPLQDRLIQCFHQALRPRGLLFIGQSESLSFAGNALFSPIDHYHRLYCKRH